MIICIHWILRLVIVVTKMKDYRRSRPSRVVTCATCKC